MEEDYKYQWEIMSEKKVAENDLNDWYSNYGPRVLERDASGKCLKVLFSVLIDNPDLDVFIVGSFNDWGRNFEDLDKYKFKKDEYSVLGSIELKGVCHKDEYKFLISHKITGEKFYIQDAAGVYFTDSGNTVFWDFGDPSCYKQKNDFVNTFDKSIKILQTDLPGLVVHYANSLGVCGKNIEQKNLYRFIADSGVIKEIKKLGFNVVQFLPFAQSIDGDNWKFRYLVPFQFAIQKNWGTPDDFAYMIDKFHEEEVAVIGDFVLGHLPFKDFSIFGQDGNSHGIHQWRKRDSKNGHKCLLYMKEETSWGTMRVDFDNPYVRDFFISSVVHFMKNYKIDGFRIDNVDGILRFGPAGDGDERPNGRTFLRELNSAIYSFNTRAIINYESHFFFGDNAKMLVAPIEIDERALGATAYNSSRITHYFHTKYMFNASEETTVWRYRDIFEEKSWGKSSSTVADFHNHDAASGLMNDRCTGAFAYNCMLEGSPGNHIHALGKIKVMEAIISFGCEGRTLDLLQTFLLQPGTFEHNSSIEWFQTFNEVNRAMIDFKKDVNFLMDAPAFWPKNSRYTKFLNVDDKNKVLVIERKDGNDKYLVVINTSAWKHYDYRVGVDSGSDYQLVFNSDALKYAGFGMASYPDFFRVSNSSNFEFLNKEIVLDVLPPYAVVVLKQM